MGGGWGGEWGRGRGCDAFKMAAGTVESLVGREREEAARVAFFVG